MSKETTENFWTTWNTFEWPEPQPIVYRLYYKEDGLPDYYTMDNCSGNYIEVDQPTYILGRFDLKVIDGQIHYNKPVITVGKLQPSTTGTACNPHDVCVVVAPDQPHIKWNMTQHEIN